MLLHVLGVLFLFLFDGNLVDSSKAEKRLLNNVLTHYAISIRPSINPKEPLNISLRVSLRSIIDVDERNQMIHTTVRIMTKWNDCNLRWNVTEYEEIGDLMIPYNMIWTPDILLYNNAAEKYWTSLISTNVLVSNTGDVSWPQHGIFYSSCNMDIRYFPFDVQTCYMKWGSWAYDVDEINLYESESNGDISTYEDNGEFELLEYFPTRNIADYEDDLNSFVDITYTIKIRRRPLSYIFNLILPCSLINAVALLVFYVPCQTGEKVTLGISSLVSLTVFLMNIKETLPASESMPIISLYCGISMCSVTFAIGLSVVTLNFYHQGERNFPIPKSFNYILKHLSTFYNFFRLKTQEKGNAQKNKKNYCKNKPYLKQHKFGNSVMFPKTKLSFIDSNGSSSRNSSQLNFGGYLNKQLTLLIRQHYEILENQEKLIHEQEKDCQLQQQWKHISIVLDRVFLVIFVFVTFITTATICGGLLKNNF